MIFSKEVNEALAILGRMLDALMGGLSTRGPTGSKLRTAVGDLRSDAPTLIDTYRIGTELGIAFEQARLAGASMTNMDNVRIAMLAENPVYDFGVAVKNSGLVFSLVEQALMISNINFISRFDVEDMMNKMLPILDDIKLSVSELIDGIDYQNIVGLSAAIVQHLAATERQLPRIVALTTTFNLPSLRIANLLYNDASRSDEIRNENRVVHPAFCPRNLRVLSA